MSDIPQVEWLGMTTRCGKRVVEVEENLGIVSFLPMDVEISQVGAGFRVEEETYRKLQYFRLELVMDREAWRAVIQGVAKSRTRLSD